MLKFVSSRTKRVYKASRSLDEIIDPSSGDEDEEHSTERSIWRPLDMFDNRSDIDSNTRVLTTIQRSTGSRSTPLPRRSLSLDDIYEIKDIDLEDDGMARNGSDTFEETNDDSFPYGGDQYFNNRTDVLRDGYNDNFKDDKNGGDEGLSTKGYVDEDYIYSSDGDFLDDEEEMEEEGSQEIDFEKRLLDYLRAGEQFNLNHQRQHSNNSNSTLSVGAGSFNGSLNSSCSDLYQNQNNSVSLGVLSISSFLGSGKKTPSPSKLTPTDEIGNVEELHEKFEKYNTIQAGSMNGHQSNTLKQMVSLFKPRTSPATQVEYRVSYVERALQSSKANVGQISV